MTGRLWQPLSAMGQDVECDARGSTPFVVVREKLAQDQISNSGVSFHSHEVNIGVKR